MTKRSAPSGITWEGVKIEHLKRYQLVTALETMVRLYEKERARVTNSHPKKT